MDTDYNIAEFFKYHSLPIKDQKIEFSKVLEALGNISSHGQCVQVDAKQKG